MVVYKCDICGKVFTEKSSLSRHEKNTYGEKTVTHVSFAIKSVGEQRICVDMLQIQT